MLRGDTAMGGCERDKLRSGGELWPYVIAPSRSDWPTRLGPCFVSRSASNQYSFLLPLRVSLLTFRRTLKPINTVTGPSLQARPSHGLSRAAATLLECLLLRSLLLLLLYTP